MDCRTSIPEVERVTKLDITEDRHLRWDKHVDNLVNKQSKLRYREYLDIKCLRQIYFAIYQSLIKYGIIAWGGLYRCLMKNEVIQKWILRVIYQKSLLFLSDDL